MKGQTRGIRRATMLTECSDEEDEAAELMRELEKIKRERLEQKEKEVIAITRCLWIGTHRYRNASALRKRRSSGRSILLEATRCSTPRTST